MFRLNPFHKLATLAFGAGLALAPAGADAFTIQSGDLPVYAADVDLGFAKVTAVPTVFAHKSVAGYDVVGVLGGWEGGEVDLAQESQIGRAHV